VVPTLPPYLVTFLHPLPVLPPVGPPAVVYSGVHGSLRRVMERKGCLPLVVPLWAPVGGVIPLSFHQPCCSLWLVVQGDE